MSGYLIPSPWAGHKLLPGAFKWKKNERMSYFLVSFAFILKSAYLKSKSLPLFSIFKEQIVS